MAIRGSNPGSTDCTVELSATGKVAIRSGLGVESGEVHPAYENLSRRDDFEARNAVGDVVGGGSIMFSAAANACVARLRARVFGQFADFR